jgi:hypothetical protein
MFFWVFFSSALEMGTVIVQVLIDGFQAHPFDAFLYGINEVIAVVGRIPAISPSFAAATTLLSDTFTAVNSAVLPRLSTEGDFKEQPELVEEWMESLGKMIRRNPVILLTSPQLADILTRAYGAGLYMAHRNAARSVCLFFEHLFELAAPKKNSSQEVLGLLGQLVAEHGEALVANLLGGVAGYLHRASTKNAKNVVELLAGVLGHQNMQTLVQWIENWFRRVPLEAVDEEMRREFFGLLFVNDAASGVQLADSRTMLDALRVIEDVMIKYEYLPSQ